MAGMEIFHDPAVQLAKALCKFERAYIQSVRWVCPAATAYH